MRAASGAGALFLVAAAAVPALGQNAVGEMRVVGDAPASATVSVTGHESWNAPTQAMTQNVSTGIAKANKAQSSSGNFKVWTGPRPGFSGNQWKPGGGAWSTTVDLNFFDGGSTTDGYAYRNHTTWNNPLGACATSNVAPRQVHKLGTVTLNSAGNISGGAGTYFVSYSSNWAWFKFPVANAKVSVSPKESGVCWTTGNSVNGNQAPITIVPGSSSPSDSWPGTRSLPPLRIAIHQQAKIAKRLLLETLTPRRGMKSRKWS